MLNGFQSTHPLRGATRNHPVFQVYRKNFNPRTPCGVRRDFEVFVLFFSVFQSTHPLRGATGLVGGSAVGIVISIHAPLAGCDRPGKGTDRSAQTDFNPRTPCGVRLGVLDIAFQGSNISIHAPLAGCDASCVVCSCCTSYFNPRTPCGVRPCTSRSAAALSSYFNPRTPCGVRHHVDRIGMGGDRFQSTHPLRGATCRRWGWRYWHQRFQSTHPLRGATGSRRWQHYDLSDFNPRTPCGVRLRGQGCNRWRR